MNQHWYHCHTCKMNDGVGVCTVCAKVCHKDHDITYAKFGSFFCDCGAKEDGSCIVSIYQLRRTHIITQYYAFLWPYYTIKTTALCLLHPISLLHVELTSLFRKRGNKGLHFVPDRLLCFLSCVVVMIILNI